MELGDKTCYYTHEANNHDHNVNDQLAFIVGGPYPNGSVDLMVCPVGGPITFVKANEFDPDDPYLAPGTAYYRPWGEEPPAFEDTFPYAFDGRWAQLRNRQIAERDAATQAQRDALRKEHLAQRDQLGEQIAQDYRVPDAEVEDDEVDEAAPNGRRV